MDSFDEAQSSLEQQRRDYLAAMAQAGSQGAQEFTQAQADLNGQKNAAVQQALAEAARRGAPQGMQDSVAYQTGSPYDRRTADLTSSNASHSASFGANKSAGDTVIAQAIANIPALRAMSQRQAEAERFKAQVQQAKDALDMQLKQIDLQIAVTNRDRARSGGSDGSGDPSLRALHALDLQDRLNKPPTVPPGSGNKSGWVNAGPKAKSVLEIVVNSNDNLGDAIADLHAAAGRGYPDPYYTPKDKNDRAPSMTGGTKLDLGAMESWLRAYYGA